MKLLEELAMEALPPEEYLAPNNILELSRETDMDFRALYDKDCFIGYSDVVRHSNMAYLFFLAIIPENRSKGSGSNILISLSEKYKSYQFTVDFEMIDENASNNEQRIRRKGFYMRNGFKETDLSLTYFGVWYEVMCKNCDFNIKTFKEMYTKFLSKASIPYSLPNHDLSQLPTSSKFAVMFDINS